MIKNKYIYGALTLLLSIILCAIVLCSCDAKQTTKTKIESLKGPTSVGLLQMMRDEQDSFDFDVVAQPDAIVSDIASNKVDIALLPANLAATIYQKDNSKIKIIDINTLSVLYFMSQDTSIKSLDDLKGKTLYLSGKGTIVQATIEIILAKNNIDINSINIEYKSEASEIIQLLHENKNAVGLINEPQATICENKFSSIKRLINAGEVWKQLFGADQEIVTGVAVVRNDYLQNNKDKVNNFLDKHCKSINFSINNLEDSVNIWKDKVSNNQEITTNSIKNSNVKYIDGNDMAKTLDDFYKILGSNNIKLIGGKVPDNNIYYIK